MNLSGSKSKMVTQSLFGSGSSRFRVFKAIETTTKTHINDIYNVIKRYDRFSLPRTFGLMGTVLGLK